VTFPALRVDNELALWRYDGTLVYREKGIEQLYQVPTVPCGGLGAGGWGLRVVGTNRTLRGAGGWGLRVVGWGCKYRGLE
jgi:hypothetical protein